MRSRRALPSSAPCVTLRRDAGPVRQGARWFSAAGFRPSLPGHSAVAEVFAALGRWVVRPAPPIRCPRTPPAYPSPRRPRKPPQPTRCSRQASRRTRRHGEAPSGPRAAPGPLPRMPGGPAGWAKWRGGLRAASPAKRLDASPQYAVLSTTLSSTLYYSA